MKKYFIVTYFFLIVASFVVLIKGFGVESCSITATRYVFWFIPFHTTEEVVEFNNIGALAYVGDKEKTKGDFYFYKDEQVVRIERYVELLGGGSGLYETVNYTYVDDDRRLLKAITTIKDSSYVSDSEYFEYDLSGKLSKKRYIRYESNGDTNTVRESGFLYANDSITVCVDYTDYRGKKDSIKEIYFKNWLVSLSYGSSLKSFKYDENMNLLEVLDGDLKTQYQYENNKLVRVISSYGGIENYHYRNDGSIKSHTVKEALGSRIVYEYPSCLHYNVDPRLNYSFSSRMYGNKYIHRYSKL